MKNYSYRLPERSLKKDYIFNMMGSMVNSVVSVILLVVVSHVLGATAAGIFSVGYSTAQMMYIISVFEMRNIQVTDAKRTFSFAEVTGFRVVTTVAMWLFFVAFCIVRGYSGEKLCLMAVLTFYMSMLSFSDLFQGNLQLNGYLSLAGLSLAGSVALAALTFVAVLAISKNLVLAVCGMAIAAFFWVAFYDIPFNNNFTRIKFSFEFKKQKQILLCALPLFLSSFMQQYIFNSSKYAIDSVLTEVDQSHYGYLTMPIFCINLLSIFVFRPQLVTLSENWAKREIAAFKKTVAVLFLWIAGFTAAALLGGYLLGIPVLELLYGADLSGKRSVFLVLLLAGGFSAACSLTLTLFTILRKQRLCLYAYAVTLLFSIIVPEYAVRCWKIMGAAISYLAEMALLFAVMAVLFVIVFKREKNANE